MPLARRVRLLTSLAAVAAVVPALACEVPRAGRRATEERRLREARATFEVLQEDRLAALRLAVRVLAHDPQFAAATATDPVTVHDMLQERGGDLNASFLIATNHAGIVIARTDRIGAQGEDLSKHPVVVKARAHEEGASLWRQGDELFHVVSVPMRFGQDLVGVLVAGYAIDAAWVTRIQRYTHCQVACLVRTKGQGPRLSVSSLGAREADLGTNLEKLPGASSDDAFEIELGREPYLTLQVPLGPAAGEPEGSLLLLRGSSE